MSCSRCCKYSSAKTADVGHHFVCNIGNYDRGNFCLNMHNKFTAEIKIKMKLNYCFRSSSYSKDISQKNLAVSSIPHRATDFSNRM